MKGLIGEIHEIPQRAKECLERNRELTLPRSVPYLGMGSSYFAPLTLFFAGANIQPQIASEYYNYLSTKKAPLGVLISQSGESSETVWNLERFREVVVITNRKDSTLASARNTKKIIEIFAGEERFSSTKTYINTLIVLYLGLGIDPRPSVQLLREQLPSYEERGRQMAGKIHEYLKSHPMKGIYVIGSGPNLATAYEAALTLSETTKLSWIGMPLAQYDHGPKETADNTIVLILSANGKDRKRIEVLETLLSRKSNALTLRIEEIALTEALSPPSLITQANFLMNDLADLLKVGETFTLGGKVTTVSK